MTESEGLWNVTEKNAGGTGGFLIGKPGQVVRPLQVKNNGPGNIASLLALALWRPVFLR